MSTHFWGYTDSPIGLLEIGGTDVAIVAVNFVETLRDAVASNAIVETAIRQLTEYFAGNRQAFDLPLAPSGTEFQQAVWQQVRGIPYGQTVSYGEW